MVKAPILPRLHAIAVEKKVEGLPIIEDLIAIMDNVECC